MDIDDKEITLEIAETVRRLNDLLDSAVRNRIMADIQVLDITTYGDAVKRQKISIDRFYKLL